MQTDPEFVLNIDGRKWTVWQTISLSRSIERMGGSFNVTLAQKPEEGFLSTAMKIGLPVQVEIDGQTVLDGWIDDVDHSYDKSSAQISVTGRDKTGDLIDCAASVDGPFEFTGLKLEKAIEKVLAPYKIPLTVNADTGAAFSRIAIQPGETVHAFIDRICRFRAVLPVSDGIGGLVLVKPGNEKSPGRLIYGANILQGRVAMKGTERFSLYVLKGQSEASDTSSGDDIVGGEGRAKDELVTRYRPTVITAESQGYTQTLQERAEWQRNVSRARGNTATYTVAGWYADPDAKTLWKPNTLVRVDDPARTLNREMLITSLTFERTRQNGTRTTLELAVPEAFELVAEVDPKADDDLVGES
ncbi:phage baseplate assembly protein [Micavibrio aeruginosavorus]|uniref:phage baseplate assembly protein n=1 Tax=Micavibrio aeruginosavorus TaxID=349221 RepID=UPI003F4AA4FB